MPGVGRGVCVKGRGGLLWFQLFCLAGEKGPDLVFLRVSSAAVSQTHCPFLVAAHFAFIQLPALSFILGVVMVVVMVGGYSPGDFPERIPVEMAYGEREIC